MAILYDMGIVLFKSLKNSPVIAGVKAFYERLDIIAHHNHALTGCQSGLSLADSVRSRWLTFCCGVTRLDEVKCATFFRQ